MIDHAVDRSLGNTSFKRGLVYDIIIGNVILHLTDFWGDVNL